MAERINIRKYLKKKYGTRQYRIARECFIEYMIDNMWFGLTPCVEYDFGEKTIFFTSEEVELFEDKFEFYMQHHFLNAKEKVDVLSDLLASKFPESASHLSNYLESEKNDNINEALLNFLVYYLEKEISNYTNIEMRALIERMTDEAPLSVGIRFTDFLSIMRCKTNTKYTNDFTMHQRNTESRVKTAYDSETYLKLAYYLFNEDYIAENEMVADACASWKTANAWLYLAIHMICSLRDSDIVLLPHPRLNKAPEEIIKSIESDTFSDAEAKACVFSMVSKLGFFSSAPNKTAAASNIPSIKLHIPESGQVLFGKLFALAEAHRRISRNNADNLIKPVHDYDLICTHLGDDIGYLFLQDNFSTRSANKTYMQAIELFADQVLDLNGNMTHAKGYMLAALARSHKGSFGEFAQTSEIYLKDAKFSGYSPEFIVKELFERGVCSFIPSMLLTMVTDGSYAKLPIGHQTELIQHLSLSAGNVEDLIDIVKTTKEKTKEMVAAIVQTSPSEPTYNSDILQILQNIAAGGAVSKQNNVMCLMTAMGKGCTSPSSQQCIGCQYEISTKSAIFTMMSEYQRMQQLKETAQYPHIKAKYVSLLKTVLVPKISEVLICMQETYGEESIHELEAIIKEMQNEFQSS